MAYTVPEPKIFACSASTELAEKIAKAFGSELGKVHFSRFSDGEFQPSFEESVRGARVFIIGSTHPSSENLMEMLLMLDAAKGLLQDTLRLLCLILVGLCQIERQTSSAHSRKISCQPSGNSRSNTNHNYGFAR